MISAKKKIDMLAETALRKPESWQELEILCRKLWSDIWDCSEIKKIGRFPRHKTPYTKNYQSCSFQHISKKEIPDVFKEIDRGIEKSRRFSPGLKKLFFISMGETDDLIEKYIVKKDQKCESLGSFEVYLFSWDDITDLINGNESVRDWYLSAVSISFDNDDVNLEYNIQMSRRIVNFCHRPSPQPVGCLVPNIIEDIDLMRSRRTIRNAKSTNLVWVNKSYANFSIKIRNTGDVDLMDYQLKIEIKGIKELQFSGVTRDSEGNKNEVPFGIKKVKGRFNWEMLPNDNRILARDYIILENISVRPLEEQGVVYFSWKFESSECTQEGMLALNYSTDFITKWINVIIASTEKQKQEVIYDDYYERKVDRI